MHTTYTNAGELCFVRDYESCVRSNLSRIAGSQTTGNKIASWIC